MLVFTVSGPVPFTPEDLETQRTPMNDVTLWRLCGGFPPVGRRALDLDFRQWDVPLGGVRIGGLNLSRILVKIDE